MTTFCRLEEYVIACTVARAAAENMSIEDLVSMGIDILQRGNDSTTAAAVMTELAKRMSQGVSIRIEK